MGWVRIPIHGREEAMHRGIAIEGCNYTWALLGGAQRPLCHIKRLTKVWIARGALLQMLHWSPRTTSYTSACRQPLLSGNSQALSSGYAKVIFLEVPLYPINELEILSHVQKNGGQILYEYGTTFFSISTPNYCLRPINLDIWCAWKKYNISSANIQNTKVHWCCYCNTYNGFQ